MICRLFQTSLVPSSKPATSSKHPKPPGQAREEFSEEEEDDDGSETSDEDDDDDDEPGVTLEG